MDNRRVYCEVKNMKMNQKMTRTIKYKELRAELEAENKRHQEEMKSENPYIRKGAMILDSFRCLGRRGKHDKNR